METLYFISSEWGGQDGGLGGYAERSMRSKAINLSYISPESEGGCFKVIRIDPLGRLQRSYKCVHLSLNVACSIPLKDEDGA
jgi:hypothetical protein